MLGKENVKQDKMTSSLLWSVRQDVTGWGRQSLQELLPSWEDFTGTVPSAWVFEPNGNFNR